MILWSPPAFLMHPRGTNFGRLAGNVEIFFPQMRLGVRCAKTSPVGGVQMHNWIRESWPSRYFWRRFEPSWQGGRTDRRTAKGRGGPLGVFGQQTRVSLHLGRETKFKYWGILWPDSEVCSTNVPQFNKTMLQLSGGGGYKPKCRFDRVYFRNSSQSPISPQTFNLIGIEKVPGTQRFPSDHWGILCTFDL